MLFRSHTLIVAISAYLLSLDLGCCKQMRINHFLCGLFHDLPEILTRDIISPIKHTVKGLDEFIKNIERQAVNDKILCKVPPNIRDDIEYFTQDEFNNRYKIEHFRYDMQNGADFFAQFNEDKFDPIYGEFLKVCDNLSAFLEAKISIAHGVSSQDLIEGAQGIFQKCADKEIANVDLGAIFRNFA